MSKIKRVVKASYSFAVNGGAAGAIVPNPLAKAPIGAVITGAWTEGANLAKTSSATFAIAVGGVTVKGATAVDSADFAGLDAQLAATTLNKVTTNAPITLTIAGGTVTAGTLDVFVEYTI
jgi:hypothetical protein